MAINIVYDQTTGQIRALVPTEANIEAVAANWPNTAWTTSDVNYQFEHLQYIRVDPATGQVVKK